LSGELWSSILNGIFSSAGETLVVRKKVREILFEGYHVNFLNELIGLTTKFGMKMQSPLPNNTFGLFYNKNRTSPGLYSMNTGVRDVMQLKQITSFRNRPKVPHWMGDTCNQLNGTDGSAFHPKVKRDETLYLFNVDLCRSVKHPINVEDNDDHTSRKLTLTTFSCLLVFPNQQISLHEV
jgi:hypothetical protein